MKRLKRDRRGVSNIIVVVLGLVIVIAIVSNVVLWSYEMNQLDWEKMREEIDITSVTDLNETSLHNPQGYTLGGGATWVSGNISNLASDNGIYMTFESYYSGTNILDFVDDNNSNVDSSVDKGTHSNFTAQQYGPDSIIDSLVEENTAGNNLNFLYVDNYDGLRTDWTRIGTAPYLSIIDYTSNYIYASKNNYQIGDFGFENSGLSSETIQSVTIQLYAKQTETNNPLQLYIWDGSTWTNLGLRTPSTSWSWINYTATTQLDSWTKINSAKIYFQTATAAGLYQVDCARLMIDYVEPDNYEVDLEVQWNNVNFNEANEFLCIYGGTMELENIIVDVWNGSDWENLFSDLASGWNNVSVSEYLTSSNFVIRFKGTNETDDTIQDSWDVDATFLHAWTDQYTSEVEFTGSSNLNHWSQLNWTVDSAWTTGSVDVILQLYNYALNNYPTSGDGYITYVSNETQNMDENKSQTIVVNPTRFRNATGYWKVKVKGIKQTDTQFDSKVDWIEFKAHATGTRFTFKNNGAPTAHLVSLWVNNATHHERYDLSIFLNAGDTKSHIRGDIGFPEKPYVIKVVSEKGNIAIYAES